MYSPAGSCPEETSQHPTPNRAAEWSPCCMIGEEISAQVPAKPGTLPACGQEKLFIKKDKVQ